MEIDTGSPVCVITREMYETHRKTWPRLQKPQVKLGCYMGSIPVVGELTMKVVYQSTTVQGTLTVVDCRSPCLCGRDLIQKLNQRGVPVLSLTAIPKSPCGQQQGLQSLLDEYEDLFSPELGLIQGPPAHLYLKDGATPKFCK
ncbi:unnamed protein product, partial [Ixodes pacificus]